MPLNNQTNSFSSLRSGGPSRQTPTAGFPWKLLILSIIVFGLSILIYLGMEFGYAKYLESQITATEKQFSELSSKITEDQRQNLLDFYSQLYNIQSLSLSHIYISNFFNFLEKYIYPNVKITGLQLPTSGGEIKIEGVSGDFDTISNQLSMLKTDPNVLSVALDSSKQRDPKEGGGIQFSIKMILKSNFFKK